VVRDDSYWIKRVKDGRKNDFCNLVKRYKDPIYYFVLRMVHNEEDAMDLTQETFIKAYSNIKIYREQYSFKNWLFTIASHHTIDFLRKKKNTPETELLETDVDKRYIGAVESLIKKEKMKRLSQEIDLLPDKYRMVILLKHIEELKIDEISEIMDVPPGTVKVWLHRARGILRKRMKKDEKKNV
jgi:RNA polymerase sigma factor (sigma-70 family)